MRAAERCAADVVVLNDADTVPNLKALVAAIDGACNKGGLHFGLDRMQYLDAEQTDALYAGQWPTVEGLPHDSSVYAIRPADYWAVGGQYERFTEWGGEDGAFTMTAEALLGVTWHPGTALSLWHEGACRDIGSKRWWGDTYPLHKRYLDARGNPEAMRALIAERV
jgi:hypothetical protein